MNKLIAVLMLLLPVVAAAQDNIPYQKPDKAILDLVDVERAPWVLVDDEQENMVFLFRESYKSIEELSKEELRLGGLRIDPQTNINSRTTFYNSMEVKEVGETNRQVTGLPDKPMLSNFSWSPDQKMIAFTHTTENGNELWVLDIEDAKAKKLTSDNLNANLYDVASWFPDGKSLLIKVLPSDRKALIDTEAAVPTGPTISTNDGKKAQNRTYQDLLKNKMDEHNFEQLAIAEIHRVTLDGKTTKWKDAAMYRNISISPDGKYVMINTVERPFSYLVPYYRFPSKTAVYTADGKLVQTLVEVPLIEDLPQGFMAERTGKRDFSWRADKPASLIYATVLDGGDPEQEAEYRDELFQLDAPFKGDGKSILKLKNRYSAVMWGNDEMAIAYDWWWNTRNVRTLMFNPSDSKQQPVVLYDRNYQDEFSDPGSFVTRPNKYGRDVLALKDKSAFMLGDGWTEQGQFPFLNQVDLTSGKTKTIYKSAYTDKLEDLKSYNPEENSLLVSIESPSEYPDFYIRNLDDNELVRQTNFKNPFESLQNVHKEVITYKRDDGLELSGTLYLPVGYDQEKKEKAPMILWAYPREYKDKSSAGQNTQNPNEFTYPYYGSPIYWVAKGYVVLDDASFPIVGEGEEEPNDSFRKQLVANAKAAIDAVDELGYIDRNRVAVGGHSYGAFMVANLLSHSNLFAAGIARSGAYNRTLTPFGFQSEERNYWEAPEVYYTMSPFMHADKMKTPLLLIHGEADNNSGTYPMQSERYFNALKGLGATVRLVMLPKESHGYRAKESILHVLYEQDAWLDKYVKNKDAQSEVEGDMDASTDY